ncbi:RDD family protein [Halobaculum sp. P14]|uniref:RDD family protein n=1 Tax=Halobaculum sp. P14 TaxID=3421638 RepID=UPI003EBBE0C0
MPSSQPRSAQLRDRTDVVGGRIVAQIIDVIAMTVQILVVAVALGALLGGSGTGPVAVGILTLPLYGGLLEGYWDGQTLGKKFVGIRVVDRRGGDCSVGQAFVRNLPAVVMPGWLVYLVALASMAASDTRQRVFDRLAETVVVRA